MTDLLHWRFAERADRALLPEFTCTVASHKRFGSKRPHHPRPWERVVQSGFRSLQPPLGPEFVLLVGEDDKGIGALAYYAYETSDWSRIDFLGLAVECRLRGMGGAHAREAMDQALADMQGRAADAGCADQFVSARIDRRNRASKRLCAGAGFIYDSMANADLEFWTLDVAL